MRPPAPTQPSVCFAMLRASDFDDPVARFRGACGRVEERGRVRAVDGAMVERLREHADGADRDRVALGRLDDDGLLAHAVGRQDRDLRLIDDRRRDQRAERARVRQRVGAAREVVGLQLAAARALRDVGDRRRRAARRTSRSAPLMTGATRPSAPRSTAIARFTLGCRISESPCTLEFRFGNSLERVGTRRAR